MARPLFESLGNLRKATGLSKLEEGIFDVSSISAKNHCFYAKPAGSTTEDTRKSVYTYRIFFTASFLEPCALSMLV